jgi:hypothetical protein
LQPQTTASANYNSQNYRGASLHLPGNKTADLIVELQRPDLIVGVPLANPPNTNSKPGLTNPQSTKTKDPSSKH